MCDLFLKQGYNIHTGFRYIHVPYLHKLACMNTKLLGGKASENSAHECNNNCHCTLGISYNTPRMDVSDL